MVHRPSEPPPPDHYCRTRMRSLRSQSTSRTGCRGIRRAQSPRLEGWPTGVPPRVSPTAEVSTDRSACAGGKQGGRRTQEPTDTESIAAEEGRCGCTRESALPRGRGAPRRRVEPLGAETDLTALGQSSAGNHDDSDRKRSQLLQQIAKTPAPRWAPTVVVLSLTVM